MKLKILQCMLVLAPFLLLASCGGGDPQADAEAVATSVAATLAASEAAAPTDPTATTGSIAGSLSYPSEALPNLLVVAYLIGSNDWYAVSTTGNQTSYQIDDLPAGTYTVVAYVPEGDYGGGYTAAVPCGLSVECTDHSLLPVEVIGGQTTSGIDPADWYAPEGAYPPNPDKVVASTGSISGSLIFPSEVLPGMTVVAFNVDSDAWFAATTADNQDSFLIEGVPEGVYFVVAYANGLDEGAGYSAFVLCGLSVECTDHDLIPVEVMAGQTTTGIDPHDWYAEPGAFPSNPTP